MSMKRGSNWLLRSFFVCLIASGLAFGITFGLWELGYDIKLFNPIGDLQSAVVPNEERGTESKQFEPAKVSDRESTLPEVAEEPTSPETPDEPTPPSEATADIDSSAPLKDFTPTGDAISRIRSLLAASGSTPMHIAFLGDSFIEGDILVSDFRRLLQQKYGGRGVGYVPVTSPTARYRITVSQRFSGKWKAETMLHKGSFTTTGHVDQLKGDGEVTYRMVPKSQTLSSVKQVGILYESKAPATLTTTINDTITKPYELEPTGAGVLSVLWEKAPAITSFRIDAQSEALNIHGVYLDDTSGVSVDNVSVRGSSGGELTRIDKQLTQQMKRIRDYQLIVVSYGLNALSEEDNGDSYLWYYNKMKKSLQHLKSLYPDAIILVLSVSDRATLVEGKAVTLPAVYKVRKHQLRLAHEEGCLFWDTFAVVQEKGGIDTFVKKKWAAKDYTHLSSAGGRELAQSLYQYLVEE